MDTVYSPKVRAMIAAANPSDMPTFNRIVSLSSAMLPKPVLIVTSYFSNGANPRNNAQDAASLICLVSGGT